MDFGEIATRGLLLLGCGKMGSAMLQGWLTHGLAADRVWVMDPQPSDWVMGTGVHVNAQNLPTNPAVVIIAVKPQLVEDALPAVLQWRGGETIYISIAAGTTIASFESTLEQPTPVVRAMPNTPAAVGKGITALIGNAEVSEAQLGLARALLSVVGQTLRLTDEAQMDAVTAVSGSGPAYVFHLIETLAAAGEAEGLPADLAMQLAKATVAGAGALAEASDASPAELRVNVTSPGGTTAAALDVLMDDVLGFPALLKKGVAAAARRSRELGA
jgi:pyrroline-5-carboxylate reductase